MEEQKKVDSKKGFLGIGGSSGADKKKAQDAVTAAPGSLGGN